MWAFRGETGEHPIGGALRFTIEESALIGAYVAPNGKATRLANLVVAGDQISFDIVGPLGSWHLVGTISGNRMAGSFQTLTRTIPWAAVHQRETAQPATPPPAATPTAPRS